ncbi:hypothetical protein [Streptomyces sp. NPDC056190]|uniref:hypothetical protein n=1 Tax=Streptomyces sp. NPDC056190 TaxID=3345741 RepID=UPI0035DA531E
MPAAFAAFATLSASATLSALATFSALSALATLSVATVAPVVVAVIMATGGEENIEDRHGLPPEYARGI